MKARRRRNADVEAYHPYVFDHEARTFVGRFEEMYAAERNEGFDSWHERDLRLLRKKISLTILEGHNWERVLDLGCGKGTFTHLLKRENNRVVGIDIAPSAIRRAQASYPDVEFVCADASSIANLGSFDLAVVMSVLAYVPQWREALARLANVTRWIYVAEYIPNDPIGFVKSSHELIEELERYFVISTSVTLNSDTFMYLAENVSSPK